MSHILLLKADTRPIVGVHDPLGQIDFFAAVNHAEDSMEELIKQLGTCTGALSDGHTVLAFGVMEARNRVTVALGTLDEFLKRAYTKI